MFNLIDRLTRALVFVPVAVVLLASPWLFGAWEMWWFWPLTALLFAAVLLFALRLVLFKGGYPPPPDCRRRQALMLLWGWLPFLLYALIRARQAAVYMDAERSFLLFLTPLMLGTTIAFGLSRRQLMALCWLLLVNLAVLGIYGIVNWYVTRGEFVMWKPGYPQYILDERASGSYFCPNHFAGVMEFAFCAGLAVMITRTASRWIKIPAAALLAVSSWAIVLSKSRGTVIALAVVLVLALCIGFLQWRPLFRHGLAMLVLAFMVGVTAMAVVTDTPFMQRFRSYPWSQIEHACRYQMIAGGLRAWSSSPVWGIGPGMHRHLWPHFAAGPGGDREAARWPRFPNDSFHSYEVHSDWVQLLEEYGVVGLALFLWALGVTAVPFGFALRAEWRRQRAAAWRAPASMGYTVVMTALLSAMAMAVHSLGDFNLQMPATVWLLAGIIALAMAFMLRPLPDAGS